VIFPKPAFRFRSVFVFLVVSPFRLRVSQHLDHGRNAACTFRRYYHPRAWDDAFIDRIAKVYIRRPAARQIARSVTICRGKRPSGLNDERHQDPENPLIKKAASDPRRMPRWLKTGSAYYCDMTAWRSDSLPLVP
jgi:hypothetical protein